MFLFLFFLLGSWFFLDFPRISAMRFLHFSMILNVFANFCAFFLFCKDHCLLSSFGRVLIDFLHYWRMLHVLISFHFFLSCLCDILSSSYGLFDFFDFVSYTSSLGFPSAFCFSCRGCGLLFRCCHTTYTIDVAIGVIKQTYR